LGEPSPVLVLIFEDPRTSHRANEALRIALGVVAGESAVTVVLIGPAAHLLDTDTDDLVDGDDIVKFRDSLKRLGITFYVERSAIPADGHGWNEDGHTVVPVSPDEIATLVARAERFIVF